MSRWYDKHPRLGKNLDMLKDIEQNIREPILNDILDFIRKEQPSLITIEKTYEFPLNLTRVRWYEKDPHCWFVFNALEFADLSTLKAVENILEGRLMPVV